MFMLRPHLLSLITIRGHMLLSKQKSFNSQFEAVEGLYVFEVERKIIIYYN